MDVNLLTPQEFANDPATAAQYGSYQAYVNHVGGGSPTIAGSIQPTPAAPAAPPDSIAGAMQARAFQQPDRMGYLVASPDGEGGWTRGGQAFYPGGGRRGQLPPGLSTGAGVSGRPANVNMGGLGETGSGLRGYGGAVGPGFGNFGIGAMGPAMDTMGAYAAGLAGRAGLAGYQSDQQALENEAQGGGGGYQGGAAQGGMGGRPY